MSTNNRWGAIPLEEPTQENFSTFSAEKYGAIPLNEPTAGTVALEGLKGAGRVGGRGAAAALSAPARFGGHLLEFLGNLYPTEEPTTRNLPYRAIKNMGKYLRETGEGGQKYLQGIIEKGLGTSYSSLEDALTGFGERFGDIAGTGINPVAALGGAAFGEGSKILGAPPEVQAITEVLGTGGRDAVEGIKSLAKSPVLEKSGLQLPRIVDKTREGMRIFKAKVFPGAKTKAYEKVSKQSEELIKDLQKKELPLSAELEKGIDVEGRVLGQLDEIRNISSKMNHKIESNLIGDYLSEQKSQLKKAPIPSGEKDDILKLIEKYETKFGRVEGGKRFYSPEEYIQQYRDIWEDSKNLFETKLLKGERGQTRKFYGGLNDSIAKTLEAGTPKPFSELFKRTNQEFSQLRKIDTFENIMKSVTKDGVINPNAFASHFTNPKKSRSLKKQIGEDAYNKMKLISNDLSKVKDKFDLVDELNLPSLIRSGVTYSVLAKLGIPFAKGAQVGKKVGDLAYGYMLLNPKGVRDTQNFLKAVRSGNKKMVQRALMRLDQGAAEFEKYEGSEEEEG